MKVQSVLPVNGGHRGWRHEGAVVTGSATQKRRDSSVCARPMSVPVLRVGARPKGPLPSVCVEPKSRGQQATHLTSYDIMTVMVMQFVVTQDDGYRNGGMKGQFYRSNSLGTAPMHRVDKEEECTFIRRSIAHTTHLHTPHHTTPQHT